MIRNLFDRLTPYSFKNIAIIFCLAGDLIISKFLWDRFSNREQFSEYFQVSQILKEISSERNISLIVPVSQTLFFDQKLNISREVLQRLNARLPDLKLEFEPK